MARLSDLFGSVEVLLSRAFGSEQLAPPIRAPGPTLDRYKEINESLFSEHSKGNPMEASFVLTTILDCFTRYDLGPTQKQETQELAKYLQDKIDSGLIKMDDEFGQATVIKKALGVMHEGDLPRNMISNHADRVNKAEMKAAHERKTASLNGNPSNP